MVRVYSAIDSLTCRQRAISGKDGVYTVSDNCGNPTIQTISQIAGNTAGLLTERVFIGIVFKNMSVSYAGW